MSRRRLKAFGVLEIAIIAFAFLFGMSIILINQILVMRGLVVSKKVIQSNMYMDDRGTGLLSLMYSGDEINTMHVLGMLSADDYEKYFNDYLKEIGERVEKMGPNHELTIGGESIEYYLGKAGKTKTPTYTDLSSQTCGLNPPAGSNIELEWPSSGKRVTSGFGYRELNSGCDCHGGVDVGGDGLDVYAAADGVVVDIYPDPDKGETACEEVDNCISSYVSACKCNHGYGNKVVIEHEFDGKKYRTYYYHLGSVDSSLKKGSDVKAGDVIAKSGNTGYSSGAHLHFQLGKGSYAGDDNSMNPCELFKTKDWSGDCIHEFPDACKTFKVYGTYIPIPGAQPGNINMEVSLRAW